MEKGKIAKFFDELDANGNATHCSVIPDLAPGFHSWRVLIPFWMRGEAADLEVGDGVIFELFADQSGCLLCRADGTGGNVLPAKGSQVIIIGARDGAEALVRADKLSTVLQDIKGAFDQLVFDFNSHTQAVSGAAAKAPDVPSNASFDLPADDCGAENVKGV